MVAVRDARIPLLLAFVVERDGYRCRVCDAPGRNKREFIVRYRVAEDLFWPQSPPLLPQMWREQHPKGT